MPSKEHEVVVDFLCKKFGLRAIKNRVNPCGITAKGFYLPDVVGKKSEWEVETIPGKSHLESKVWRWAENYNKKVLVLCPIDYIYEKWDEVYIYNKGKLITLHKRTADYPQTQK